MSEQTHPGSEASTPPPQAGSVALFSWNGGFALGQVTNVTPRRLRYQLGRYPDHTGTLRWAVRSWTVLGDENPKCDLNWCLWLPTRTEAAATMYFVDIQAQIRYKRAAVAPSRHEPHRARDLTDSQLRFLAKTYPRTVALFRAQPPESMPEQARLHCEQLRKAFIEETFACSRVLLEPAGDGDQLLRMAHLFAKMSARKRKADAVEREMILGCYDKGYCRITLPQLRQAIHAATGQTLTIDAIRQKWKRLGLPSERRRGRRKPSP
jgi:hypothetical protein